MSNKKITQLNINVNPSISDVIPIVHSGQTMQISISGVTDLIKPFFGTISGGTYNDETNVLTLNSTLGNPVVITGVTNNVKHWNYNVDKTLKNDETIVVSGDYVLENTNLTLMSGESKTIGSLTFNKQAQIYIGGNLLLLDSNIINNGFINIAGAIIFSGNSTITGTGILT